VTPMAGVRTRVRRLVSGVDPAEIGSLAEDLRALQRRVDEMHAHLRAVEARQDEAVVRQGEDIDAIRRSIAEVTDDLGERIAALQRRSGVVEGGA